ncbi:TIGR03915 family putative DNA repair protein [Asticcacaulis sp. 201]|uniref:TIGR03915 family putative DNA repair protein n=1 Tax=Asticcacaulis sp. 201 TaxID=3028787 RepID=UPI002916514F|nr:TIGR03915 family putative DNA repair protein [Asticcacaulis sp. 201]MDV6332117.1 TIGR03915 family putative DNA repair protein [Asticcacaulis sp. 201]
MRIVLRARGDFEEWRTAARALLSQGVAPRDIEWVGEDAAGTDLFSAPATPPMGGTVPVSVPKAFLPLAESLICHSDPSRFDLAYRLLWRLQTENTLLHIRSDPDVARAHAFDRSVHRDSHKMHAFVRFKEIPSDNERRAFVSWFEPDHFIVARNAGFFRRRFADMDWLIATPKGAISWDGTDIRFCDAPADKPDIQDDADDLWRTYFANIFNPARLKIKMMQTEMPKKYWKNLPEAKLIPDLIAGAEQRVRDMATRQASDTVPKFYERLHRRKP